MANRLAGATSPYLVQHADNPVDWFEWGPDAFAEARRRNVQVLLSVGYSACHWCHVMAHESFEDDATAAYLNAHFVAIKVDREERPDVDAVYLRATTAMSGSAGWPMTCVLDHDGTPFFAGTYVPDTPRGGSPSFRQILESLADAWETRADEVGRVAASLREHLARTLPDVGGPTDPAALDALVDRAVESLQADFDAGAAGFGGAPKFPPSMVLEFLLRQGGPEARSMLERTCEAMARGGLYDQLGGGFARYSVDRDWVVPHFEKMLYDNGQLLGVYARWAAVTGSALGARVARETADFLLGELRTPQGGFASALDADSEGVEGKFYAWTPEQLTAVLGDDDSAWAAEVFGVTIAGTFEHGASTLQLPGDPDAHRWADVRGRLLAARGERIRPARDDKVVAAWNGLAVSGLCAAGTLLGVPEYLDAAAAAGELLAGLHTPDGRLLRISRDGVAGRHPAVLEDLGCVAAGYLDLLQATGDARWLRRAEALLDDALARFRADDGGFHDTGSPDTAAAAADAGLLPARPRDPSDNASPGGLSSIIHALIPYAAVTGSGRHRGAAEEALGTVTGLAAQAPRFAGWTLAAAAVMRRGPLEVAIVGPVGADRSALESAARRAPGAVVLVADGPSDAVPLLRGRTAVDGRPAAYVCRGLVCDRPVTEVADLQPLLG